MERDKAIKLLLKTVDKNVLAQVIAMKAEVMPFNFSMLLAHLSLHSTTTDPKHNWFTAFGVLVINQRLIAGDVIQETRVREGKPPLSLMAKKELIDAIAAGAKLTKADAGR